jgi:hypothetical protein
MDDPRQETMLEELRKLRGEVRALRVRLMWLTALLAAGIVAAATELNWYRDSLVAVILAGIFAGLVWIAWCLLRARKKIRRPTTARVVITPHTASKP